MPYRLIAADLDGTLLNDSGEISDENLRAAEWLAGRGVWFVPATGRTLAEIPARVKNSPAVRWILHSNGAVLLDKESGTRELCCLSRAETAAVLDAAFRFDAHLTVRAGGLCLTDPAQNRAGAEIRYNLCAAHVDVLTKYAVLRPRLSDWTAEQEDTEVISLFFRTKEDHTRCRELLETLPGVYVASAAEYNLEIFSEKAGKGRALCRLAELLHIPREETVAAGDSGNDITMLRAAGLGLAVSNASDALKAISGAVICSNEEHILPHIARQYFGDARDNDAGAF